MEGFGAVGAIILVVVAVLYLVAPLKLFSIHSELQKIRKLLEAQDERAKAAQREHNLARANDERAA
jgi:cell division protein FtsL